MAAKYGRPLPTGFRSACRRCRTSLIGAENYLLTVCATSNSTLSAQIWWNTLPATPIPVTTPTRRAAAPEDYVRFSAELGQTPFLGRRDLLLKPIENNFAALDRFKLSSDRFVIPPHNDALMPVIGMLVADEID